MLSLPYNKFKKSIFIIKMMRFLNVIIVFLFVIKIIFLKINFLINVIEILTMMINTLISQNLITLNVNKATFLIKIKQKM